MSIIEKVKGKVGEAYQKYKEKRYERNLQRSVEREEREKAYKEERIKLASKEGRTQAIRESKQRMSGLGGGWGKALDYIAPPIRKTQRKTTHRPKTRYVVIHGKAVPIARSSARRQTIQRQPAYRPQDLVFSSINNPLATNNNPFAVKSGKKQKKINARDLIGF